MKRRLAALLATALLAAGCGSASGAEARPTVQVLYAGSLVALMEHDLGPAFAKASGDGYQGYGAGSQQVASEIEGGVRRGDVFISASPKVDDALRQHGQLSWYAAFATAPLVLGYRPGSRFAQLLETEPWQQAITTAGLRVGRTDPTLDPKGTLTVRALQEAENAYALKGFAARVEQRSQVFPEQELVGRLESGQLDVGFFYRNEAVEQHLATAGLGRVAVAATYTVTVLAGAPHPQAGAAFVRFLLGPAGTAILRAHGLTVTTPTLTGGPVPKDLAGALKP